MALFQRSAETYDGQESESTSQGVVGGTIYWRPQTNDEVVYKYPYDDIRNGAVVITHQSQRAYLFLNGTIAHVIPPTGEPYKLQSANIPLFAKWLNAATGGSTHSTAEVWFVNVETERPALWGLGDLPMMDYSMGAEFIIGARGGYNIKITDGEVMLMKLVGTLHSFSTDDFMSYFRQKLRAIIAESIAKVNDSEQLSITSLQRNRSDISEKVEDRINSALLAYGVKITNFSIENFNIPDEYREILKEQTKGLAERRRLDKLGVGYAQERQFGIMDNAAKNEGGNVGNLMGVGMGVTMGAGIGQAMGNNLQNSFTQAGAPTMPPPMPKAAEYFIAINGQQVGPVGLEYIQQGINERAITEKTLFWQQGMSGWSEISTSNTLMASLRFLPPTLPPIL